MSETSCLSLRTFLLHSWALVWKNHLLKMRNPGILIAEMVYPLIKFCVLPL